MDGHDEAALPAPIRLCDVTVASAEVPRDARYMCDRTEDRANELERRNRRFIAALAQADPTFDPTTQTLMASQTSVMAVGRVVCDAEAATARLNDSSVLLEGCIDPCQGVRVRLDLRHLPSFSLFPGQILAVEGSNPSGYCLVAKRIVAALPYQPIAAAGPFTTIDSWSFDPLKDLIRFALQRPPDVLLLMGPFIDREHPDARDGCVDQTYEALFQQHIRTQVEDYCERAGGSCKVLLLPSLRDAHHTMIFPQPPFDSSDFEDPRKQVLMLGNPSAVILDNQIGIACSSTDILRHLSKEEIARVAPGDNATSDRISRLAAHVIGQRSFYPLFPPPPATCLDLSCCPQALDLPFAPHRLFLPSDLVPFVK
ncbi:unnamed protein product, partial [Closterium sp. Yama58-4]